MKGNTSNKVRLKFPCKSLWGVGNGKAHFCYWGEGAPDFFFTVTQIIIFLISSTSAPKNSSKRRALFSECGGMRGCSGTDEAGKEKKSQYTHYKKLDYTTAYMDAGTTIASECLLVRPLLSFPNIL